MQTSPFHHVSLIKYWPECQSQHLSASVLLFLTLSLPLCCFFSICHLSVSISVWRFFLLSAALLSPSDSYLFSSFSHLLCFFFSVCLPGLDPSLMHLGFKISPFSSLPFSRKARDSLPTFRQFFSSAFSLTHVSLASMKVPPDSLRWVAVTGENLEAPLMLWISVSLSKMQITYERRQHFILQ